MEISAVLIGLLCTLLFMGPIAYIIIQNATAQQRLTKAFRQLAKAQNLELSEIEVVGTTILASNNGNDHLIWSHTKNINGKFQICKLSAATGCEVFTEFSARKTLDVITLRIWIATELHEIEFYREDDEDTPVTDALACLQRAEHWKALVAASLRKKAA